MVLASHIESGLVPQQCILVASKLTDIVDDKDITTLNMAQHWEIFTV